MSRLRFIVASVIVVLLVCGGDAFAAKPPATKSEDPFAADTVPGKKAHLSAAAKTPVKKAHPPASRGRQLRCGEAAIEEALGKPAQLDVTETPLSDVIDFLKECHGIEIQLDRKCLNDVGIGTDTPVTIDLRNVPLRSALNLMLRDLGLTWTMQEDVLLITTPEAEESILTTKVYDVSDLVVCRDEHDALWDDYDTLFDTIDSTIRPTSWDMVGGPGSIAGASLGKAKVLVVSQTYRVHHQLTELLAGIREAAKQHPDAQIPRRNRPTSKTRARASVVWDDPTVNAPPATPSQPASGTHPGTEKSPSAPSNASKGKGGGVF